MKKWTVLALALIICLSLCACGSGDNQQPSNSVSVPISTVNEEQAGLLEDENLIAFTAQHFDLSQYSDALTNLDGIMDTSFSIVQVDDVELSFGMSFDEVKALGITPDNNSVADINPYNTIRKERFSTATNKGVSLGFIGEGPIKTHGRLVIVGTYPYEDGDALATISVDNLTIGMSMEDAINIYGLPDYIKKGVMGNEIALEMGYYSKDGNQKLEIYISPTSAAVVGIQAQAAA